MTRTSHSHRRGAVGFPGRGAWFTVALLAALTACGDGAGPVATPAPGAAFALVAGDVQSGDAGGELPKPLVVKATTTDGRPLAGVTVNFRVAAGGGSVFAGSATTNAQGLAQDYWTLGTRVGTAQTVEVRAVDATTGAKVVYGTFTATATAGPAVAVLFGLPGARFATDAPALGLPNVDGASAAGLPVRNPPFVAFYDRFLNPTSVGASATFQVASGGGSVAAGTVPASAAGISAPVWTLGPPGPPPAPPTQIPFTPPADQGLTVSLPATITTTLTFNGFGSDSAPQFGSSSNVGALPPRVVGLPAYSTAGLTLRASPAAMAGAVGTAANVLVQLLDSAGRPPVRRDPFLLEQTETYAGTTVRYRSVVYLNGDAYAGLLYRPGVVTVTFSVYGIAGTPAVTLTGS